MRATEVRRGSITRRFASSLAGNTFYNLSQWLLIVAVARFGTPQQVGDFALVMAIAAPVFMTFGLNLRVVRATDNGERWSRAEYHSLRIVLNLSAIVVTMAVGRLFTSDWGVLSALAFLSLAKTSEATSLMTYGYFQFNGRLDLVARSLMARAVCGFGAFIVVFALTTRLDLSFLGMGLSWFLVWVAHDRRQEVRLLDRQAARPPVASLRPLPVQSNRPGLRGLARTALPLGIDAGLGSVATNAPRFGIQASLGAVALGQFAALATLAQLVSMITGALGDTLIAPLARHAHDEDYHAFARTLGRLVAFGVGVAAVALAAAALIGPWVISGLLGEEFVNQPVLLALLVSAGIVTVQRSLGRGLQALHLFTAVLAVNACVLAATVIAVVILVPRYALVGAASCLGIGFAVGSVLMVFLIWVEVARRQRSIPQERP